MSKRYLFAVLLIAVLVPALALAQGIITGSVTDGSTGDALPGANVIVDGQPYGGASDLSGAYVIEGVPAGNYTVTASMIGYKGMSMSAQVATGVSTTLNFTLNSTTLQLSAVTVSGNFAKNRETPVAFTTIGEDHIKNNFTVQDVPHLFANSPGVYVTSDGGAGMGDSQVKIRGFDEQRIAVMINNVPVNDPESKKVYWSNWGSLPAAAQAIQIQRGVGSSQYGSGALGGSINVVTKDAPAKRSMGAISTLGQNGVMKYGVDFNSGLIAGKYSFIGRVNYMQGNGWRNDTFYKGAQYYFSGMMYPNDKNVFKVILHGAPQFHSYSYYGFPAAAFADRADIDTTGAGEAAYKDNYGAYVAGFGRDWNGHPYLAEDDLTDALKDRETSMMDVLFNRTEVGNSPQGGIVVGNGVASFDNNVFHKPQFELHHSLKLSDITKVTSTAFYSSGYGYGENVNSYYKVARNADGTMVADNLIAGNSSSVYQYRNYSLHSQFGILSNVETKLGQHDLSGGVEFRYWKSRHAGELLNTFGSANVTYYIGNNGQKFETGDLYYDYTTTKPQVTGFIHALWKFNALNIMTDVQVASVSYNIAEDMPNSNNYPGDTADHGGETWTGTAVDDNGDPVAYTLWDYNRSFSYVSPKLGVNYNINDDFNVFANYSSAINEPRVKFFFNYGSPNEALELENTKDLELGAGYVATLAGMPIDAKLNWYNIDFSNKALQITDPTKQNEPGYDYKGRRYIPIGSSTYSGVELAVNVAPISDLSLGLNISSSENIWGEPTDSEGSQYLYNKEAVVAGTDYTDTDGDNKWDAGEVALHQDFVGKFGARYEVGMPQFIIGGTANYTIAGITIGAAFRQYNDIYILEDNSEMLVGPGDDGLYFNADDEMSNVIPSANIIDMTVRYSLPVMNGIDLSLHMNNILDTEYWQTGDSYGFKPGAARTIVFNVGIQL